LINWIVIALCFCLLADILLLKNEYFALGQVAFLLGHLWFAKGFMELYRLQKNKMIALALIGISIGLTLGLIMT